LTAIENKDGEITIKGESPNEYSVTKFGQSLEFSGGLFSNLNIETQREVVKGTADTKSIPAGAASTDLNGVTPEVVIFTVKANFGGAKKESQPVPAPTQQVAMKK